MNVAAWHDKDATEGVKPSCCLNIERRAEVEQRAVKQIEHVHAAVGFVYEIGLGLI